MYYTCGQGGLCVQEYIRKRALDIGTYILEASATVRQTADHLVLSNEFYRIFNCQW